MYVTKDILSGKLLSSICLRGMVELHLMNQYEFQSAYQNPSNVLKPSPLVKLYKDVNKFTEGKLESFMNSGFYRIYLSSSSNIKLW